MSAQEPTRQEKIRFWAIVFGVAFVIFGGLAAWIYLSLKEGYAVRTSADARPGEGFLQLPPTASHIGYWRDGINYLAQFDIPEADFRRLFAEFPFREITEPVELWAWTFGDPAVFPVGDSSKRVRITTGLRYHERNGGLYDIVYDRERSRAYYDFSKR